MIAAPRQVTPARFIRARPCPLHVRFDRGPGMSYKVPAMKRVALVLSILCVAAGCSRSGAREAADSKAVLPPPALLVDVALPTLDGGLAGVRQFADAVQPGMSAAINERQLLASLGVGSLDGAAGDAPVHILVVDPNQHERPMAVVVAVTDAGKLKAAADAAGVAIRAKGGVAVVGSEPVVALVADWALSELPRAKAPTAPTATAFSAALLANYRTQIEGFGDSMKQTMAATAGGNATAGEIMAAYARGIVWALENSEHVTLSLDAGSTAASLSFGVAARKGSSLAAFFAAQTPSDFALLGRLPPGAAPVVMAGSWHLGPLRAEVLAFMEKILVGLYGAPASAEMTALLNAWADAATGELAVTMEMAPGRVRMTQLVAVEGAAALHTATGAFFARYAQKPLETTSMGIKTTFTGKANAVTVDGVSFHRYTSAVDTTAMPPEQAQAATMFGKEQVGLIGAWDDVVGVTMGGDQAAPKALLDASRGKGARLVLPPRVAADLADARVRKESFYYYMDLGAMVAAAVPAMSQVFSGSFGVALTFGGSDGHGHMRLAVSAADVKNAVAAAQRAGAAN